MSIDFHGPRLKIKRAKKHIADLNREILVFERKVPHKIILDRQSEPGYDLLRVVTRFEHPEDWCLLVGDAIHNLRAALDLMACDIMRWHGRGIASVHFPFSKSREDFDEVLRIRTIHRARPDIVDLFRFFEPYEGGKNPLLRAIHDLDLADKHKLLITVFNATCVNGLHVFEADGSPRLTVGKGTTLMMLQEDKILIKSLSADRMQYKYDRKVPSQVLFGKGTADLKPAIPTLAQMTKLCEEIVAAFEKQINTPYPTIYLR